MIRFGLVPACHLIMLACACGSRPGVAHQTTPVEVQGLPVTRFIPAHPTYAIAAHSIRDLQQATRDLFALGVVIDADVGQLAAFLRGVIAVDPLSADALGAIGIDVESGVAVFSESINPTVVVHLSGPDQLAGFFQQQRERGMVSQSIVVGDREIFSAKLLGGARVSWAVDGDWLWVHVALPFDRDEPDAEWFTHSRAPGTQDPAWAADWSRVATEHARLAGVVDAPAILAKLPRIDNAVACAKLLAPIGHLGLAVEGGNGEAAFRLSVDTPGDVGKALLPPPDGWAAAARSAPVAAQWNLDVPAVLRWAAPCVTLAGIDPSGIESYGVRAARVILMSFDADDTSGTGAVAVDLSSTRFVRALLDRVPLRSTLESDKPFGPYPGKTLSVPLGPTIEYVLTDSLAIVAVGEDVLARAIGRGPGAPTRTVASVDLLPGGLTADAWRYLFSSAHVPGGERGVERLQRWRTLHLALTVDAAGGRTRLTLEARGQRK